MVEVIAEALGFILVCVLGIVFGKKFAQKDPNGKLRILKDEDGESFIFLEFYSSEDKRNVESLDDGELVTFLVSHK